jgi:hypothetical protein
MPYFVAILPDSLPDSEAISVRQWPQIFSCEQVYSEQRFPSIKFYSLDD